MSTRQRCVLPRPTRRFRVIEYHPERGYVKIDVDGLKILDKVSLNRIMRAPSTFTVEDKSVAVTPSECFKGSVRYLGKWLPTSLNCFKGSVRYLGKWLPTSLNSRDLAALFSWVATSCALVGWRCRRAWF